MLNIRLKNVDEEERPLWYLSMVLKSHIYAMNGKLGQWHQLDLAKERKCLGLLRQRDGLSVAERHLVFGKLQEMTEDFA